MSASADGWSSFFLRDAATSPEACTDSTVFTARRQRAGTTVGEDTSPPTHSPSRPTRSHTRKVAYQAPRRPDTQAMTP
eukprot:2757239-Prymnesium_polylepis.1